MIAFGFASLVGISIRLLYKGTQRSLKVNIFSRYLIYGLFFLMKQLLIDYWKTFKINGKDDISILWKLEDINVKFLITIFGFSAIVIRLNEPYVIKCV